MWTMPWLHSARLWPMHTTCVNLEEQVVRRKGVYKENAHPHLIPHCLSLYPLLCLPAHLYLIPHLSLYPLLCLPPHLIPQHLSLYPLLCLPPHLISHLSLYPLLCLPPHLIPQHLSLYRLLCLPPHLIPQTSQSLPTALCNKLAQSLPNPLPPQSLPSGKLHPSPAMPSTTFNAYLEQGRKVQASRGDGNCLFRSLHFNYLAQRKNISQYALSPSVFKILIKMHSSHTSQQSISQQCHNKSSIPKKLVCMEHIWIYWL